MPTEVTIALTEIVSSAGEGLSSLAVGTGARGMHLIMDEQVATLYGPPGKLNGERLGLPLRAGRGASRLAVAASQSSATLLGSWTHDPS